MHPDRTGTGSLSIAEAVVVPGQETFCHRHVCSEEIYHITSGEGMMTLAKEIITVRKGDTVFIPPGTSHKIRNTGAEVLRILCCCVPPYTHEDTEVVL